MSVIKSFKTPEDFITYHLDKVKNELGVYDITANKVGLFGYFLNILGNTNFDSKLYYDSLFKEAFPGTAGGDDHLILHGSTYGYYPDLATPCIPTGKVSLDFYLLPTISSNVIRREVYLNTVGENLEFIIGSDIYTSSTSYIYVYENGQYSVQIIDKQGKINYLPSSTNYVSAPLTGAKQEKITTLQYRVPNYTFTTFSQYVLELAETDGFISDIKAYVTESGSNTKKEYKIKYVKYFENSNSETIFLRKLSSTKYLIEFGSGLKGKWIPNATIDFELYLTKGKNGVVAKKESGKINIPYQLTLIDKYANGTQTSQVFNTSKYVDIECELSEGGKDPLTGEDLRDELIRYIQTRDNFVSEQDFYNIVLKYFTDFKFLFKKSNLQENIFYLLRVLRDKYQNVILSSNYTSECFTETEIENITLNVSNTGILAAPKSYRYCICAYDEFENVISSGYKNINLIDPDMNSIIINWDPVPLAKKYRIYGRDLSADRFWETTDTSYTDIGDTWVFEENPFSDIQSEVSEIVTTTIPNSNGKEIGEYKYIIYSFDITDKIIEKSKIIIHDLNEKGFIQLNWKANSAATYYAIYTDDAFNKKYISLTNSWTDYNELGEIGFIPTVNNYTNTYPVFTIKEKEFISPFAYKYNPIFDWYDGYIFYNNFIVYFDYISLINDQKIKLPTFFINVEYNKNIHRTRIYLKSYQDISTWKFKISINDLSISQQDMVIKDLNSFYIDIEGLLFSSFQIEIRGIQNNVDIFNAKTEKIYQLYEIQDLLTLPFYKKYKTGEKWINQIPILEKEIFDSDPNYYIDKIKLFILGMNFEENRMVSDKLNFGFLNSYVVKSSHLDCVVKQGKYIVDGYDWKSPVITFANEKPILAPYNDDRYIVNGEYLPIVMTDSINHFIVLSGDQTTKVKMTDKIRIKNSINNNGVYNVINSVYSDSELLTYISVDEPLSSTTLDGEFGYSIEEIWRHIGPENIATFNEELDIWIINDADIILENDGVFDISTNISKIWKNSQWAVLELTLPLQLKIDAKVNKNSVTSNGIDLVVHKDKLYVQVAEKLQQEFSGIDIEFYDGKLIDFIMHSRSWIKDLDVTVTDSSLVPQVISKGIETIKDRDILKALGSNKFEIVTYQSVFWHWDINNIEINFILEER